MSYENQGRDINRLVAAASQNRLSVQQCAQILLMNLAVMDVRLLFYKCVIVSCVRYFRRG